MHATATKYLPFLEGRKQYVIPIYQRTYSWTQQQCAQLWSDILRVADDEGMDGHFIGSIVYIQQGIYQSTTIPQMLVIDGQQRLTTLALLLLALADAVDTSRVAASFSREELFDGYLTNKYGKDELRYKLLLTQADRDTLIGLIDGREPATSSARIRENFRYFQQQCASDVDLDTIYRGIGKLILVDIALDRDHDNPQLIFESLNSTGLELSQADLIRNYILMGLKVDDQRVLYDRYWFPMERQFGPTSDPSLFDRFMRDYLTLKSSSRAIPNIGRVYADF
jgi:uncharacterized protein with ParB-like and HNH nuclease domain